MSWTDVVGRIVNLRCQVCPRTSYSTTGFAASTLMTWHAASVSAQEALSLEQSVLQTREFEKTDRKTSFAEVVRDLNGHCVLLNMLCMHSESESESVRESERESVCVRENRERAREMVGEIHALLAQNRSKLVFLLLPASDGEAPLESDSSTVSDGVHYQTHLCAAEGVTLHSWNTSYGAKKRARSESLAAAEEENEHPAAKRERVLRSAMFPPLGFNNQPSVQSRCQFRFLWELMPAGSFLCPQSKMEREDIAQAKARTLYRIAEHSLFGRSDKLSIGQWDEKIRAILENGGDDYDVYDEIRRAATGSSIRAAIYETTHSSSVITKVNTASGGTASSSSSSSAAAAVSENNTTNTHAAPEGEEDGRNTFLVKNIIECMPSQHQRKVRSLLDYGCAEGALTAILRRELQLEANAVYGADVRAIPAEGFQFVQLGAENIAAGLSPALGSILPAMTDNSVQMITTSMVFHHVTFIEATILELHRVIDKKDGFLILREHDCHSRATAVFLDIVHGLYSLAWSTPVEMPDFLDEYVAFYRCKEDWDSIMRRFGFQPVTRNKTQEWQYLKPDKSKMKPDGSFPNVVRGYTAVYQPISNIKIMEATNMAGRPTSTLTIVKENNDCVKDEEARRVQEMQQQQQQQQQQAARNLKKSKRAPVLLSTDINPEEVTILESKSQPGRMYRFYRRTGKVEWIH